MPTNGQPHVKKRNLSESLTADIININGTAYVRTQQTTNIMSESQLDIYNQSAVVPFRITGGRTEILLVRNRSDKRWIIPKGIIEPDMTPQESAAQEALEEAGVTGTVLPDQIGIYEYQKWGGACKVKVYLMQVEVVLDEWLESFRKRKWVMRKDAITMLHEKELQKIIDKADIPTG